jgi:hypothetical protein
VDKIIGKHKSHANFEEEKKQALMRTFEGRKNASEPVIKPQKL